MTTRRVFTLNLKKPDAVVPCGGCTLCCQKTPVMLIPQAGDNVSSYDYELIDNGRGRPVPFLRHKPNGDCVYLGERGCTIHDRVPYACRVYDCRAHYSSFPNRKERREALLAGDVSRAILERGRQLLEEGK